MARKPKAGPPILRIEGLSTGIDPTAVDDFTQEPLAQPLARPPKIDDAQAHRDAMNRAKVVIGREVLVKTGMLKGEAKLVPPTVPGKRPIAVIQGKALMVKDKPWRRM